MPTHMSLPHRMSSCSLAWRRRCLADVVEDAEELPDSESSELWPPELLTSKRCCSTAERMVLSKSLVKKIQNESSHQVCHWLPLTICTHKFGNKGISNERSILHEQRHCMKHSSKKYLYRAWKTTKLNKSHQLDNCVSHFCESRNTEMLGTSLASYRRHSGNKGHSFNMRQTEGRFFSS